MTNRAELGGGTELNQEVSGSSERPPVERFETAIPKLYDALSELRGSEAPLEVDALFDLAPEHEHEHLRSAIWRLSERREWSVEPVMDDAGRPAAALVKKENSYKFF